MILHHMYVEHVIILPNYLIVICVITHKHALNAKHQQ